MAIRLRLIYFIKKHPALHTVYNTFKLINYQVVNETNIDINSYLFNFIKNYQDNTYFLLINYYKLIYIKNR